MVILMKHSSHMLNIKLLAIKSCIIVNPIICNAVKNLDDFGHLLENLAITWMLKNALPISDGKEFHNTGGSHWIVLVFDRSNSTFSHIDLLKNNKLSDAKRVMSKLSSWLDIQNPRLTIIDCPRSISQWLCLWYLHNIQHWENFT